MITDAASKLVDAILAKKREAEGTAQQYAISYAKDDKPENKAIFRRYYEAAEIYSAMHNLVCAGLHQVEAEMSRKTSELERQLKEADNKLKGKLP
jgi:hypothetical protein